MCLSLLTGLQDSYGPKGYYCVGYVCHLCMFLLLLKTTLISANHHHHQHLEYEYSNTRRVKEVKLLQQM